MPQPPLSVLLEFRNRPGLFAALTPEAANALTDGYMKLYWSDASGAQVETITRNRKPLNIYDPGFRLVFVALDQHGQLVTEVV
jgi:hypothetical protein